MAIRLPTAEDLRRLAEANYFELTEQELSDFQDLIPNLFAPYEQLERTPTPHAHPKYGDRDPGFRPSREEDPFNAVLLRYSLRGAPSGKLAGKRIGLKNNVCVSGIPMTCASLLLEDYVPETDATIVTRMLDAGAEIVANLNMDNFAFSGAGDTSAFGATINPHSPHHLAGGSSGGSGAALYYDYIDITIGGDQGGSIRIPSSWCGVVGLKPTHSLVPYTGIVGMDNTFDQTGPMARTVAEVAVTLEVIAGKDSLDPRQGEVPLQPYTEFLDRSVSGLRVGIVTEGFGWPRSEPDVDHAVHRALDVFKEMGAQTTDISIPAHRETDGINWGLTAEGTAALLRANGTGFHWQGFYNTSLVETLAKARRAQANNFSPSGKLMLLIGTYMTERYHGRMYAKAQNLRRDLRASYDQALQQVDILAMPTTPMKAHRYEPNIDTKNLITHGWNMSQNTAPFGMTGHPALSIPCAKSNGLPVGLMLVGKRFEDGTLLQAARAFEQQVNWETF